ncbi:DUF3833 family protein [Aureimonas flava]|uniref:DUF3833 family protein n=1 Tax=Aureimonas flava TaxID=2320271 RepID=A0A3A1WLI4_9HYPH|nr:DUF3833 family protein [Aureimonas flava]RIY01050.1 DUF3833 family protein [Aureimonas flava]
MAVAEELVHAPMTAAPLARAALVALLCLAAGPVGAADGFSLHAFFDGDRVSAGEIRTLGLFRERFTARFRGKATGAAIDLDERFAFQDGERLQRWHLVEQDGRVTGTVRTEDEAGTLQGPFPVTGRSAPDGARLAYRGIAPGGGRFALDFVHEITPRADGTVANRVRVSRFGVPLARARVTFAKSAAALQPHLSDP